jgi:hypothetical protein
MADQTNPLLPPVVWYQSEVQVRAVIALGAQLVSIILRIVGRYTELSVTTDMVDAIVADVTQAVAVIFGYMAITKRSNSTIQPLTLTPAAAEKKAETAQIDPATMALKSEGATALAAGQLAGGQPDTAKQNQSPTN